MIEQELKKITSTMWVFGLSSLGYASAYMFQYGYLHFFGVGRIAVDVDVPTIIVSIIISGAYLLNLDIIADPFRRFLVANGNRKSELDRLIVALIRLNLIALPLVYLTFFSIGILTLKNTLHLFLLVNLIIVIRLLYHSFLGRGLKKGIERMYEVIDRENAEDSTYFNKYGDYVIIVVAMLILASASGRLLAQGSRSFYVVNETGESKELVLQRYSDKLVTKKYNTLEKRFENGFKVMLIDDDVEFNSRYIIGN